MHNAGGCCIRFSAGAAREALNTLGRTTGGGMARRCQNLLRHPIRFQLQWIVGGADAQFGLQVLDAGADLACVVCARAGARALAL